ncbi:MAG: hypothetical protein IPM36_00295 [Lewinellaceae bacterium]|nr:hypothetical protein [Lewinellaceae bacterium]
MRNLLNILLLLAFANSLAGQCLQLQNCPAAPQVFCDSTANDSLFWNHPLFAAPNYLTINLPEGQTDLCFSAADTCAGANLDIQYLLFLDLNGDGDRETVVNSADLPPAGTVFFGNAGNPNYSGGTAAAFDIRQVPGGERFRFALETSGDPANRTACIRWNTADAPSDYETPQLPYGSHLVKWVVSNGLGDVDTCTYEIEVKDCLPPLVVCLNGLSVNIMPTGMITLWATDFLQYAEDNTTPGIMLEMAIRIDGNGTGFPLDSQGNPQQSATFNCNHLGSQPVELWVRDLAGNTDSCMTWVVIEDPAGFCGGNIQVYINARVCARQWCTGAVVSDVTLSNPAPWIPDFWQLYSDGCYVAERDTTISNLELTVSKNDDPLNGIDILDLVAVSKHILGLEPLANPYALVAADVNNSRSITTFDIVESRRLLTGVYDVFPSNSSWRFLDADFVFPNPNNPFQGIFPEIKQLVPVNDTIAGDFEFQAIKIGDVNCSAIPNFAPAPDDRAVAYLDLATRTLAAGETVEVPIRFAETGAWLGFQFGLQFDPEILVLEAVLPGSLPGWDAQTTFQPHPGLLNVLWFDTDPHLVSQEKTLCTLRLRALAPVDLSAALQLADGRLRAEAFTGTAEARNLQLQFSPTPPTTIRIGQPLPNPTTGSARLALELPEPMPVQLDMWDARGRLVWSQNLQGETGFQTLDLPESAFPAGGVYLWRVIAGTALHSGRLVVRP